MKDNLVSIITPVYNSEKFIAQTINSVQSQTYKFWELILVDDCSTDNSYEIIKEFVEKDNRIKYIKLSNNSGAAIARNTAIENSNGRYIAFLDSDDIWNENKLELQLKFMHENKIGFSFTSYETMSEEGVRLNKVIKVPVKISYKKYLKNTIIGCLTVIIDKKIIGDFRMPNIRSNQDMATWLYIMKDRNCEAYGLNRPLATYRRVDGSISSNKFKAAKSVWNLYRNIEGFSIIKSFYYFVHYGLNALLKRL